jgi:hypothetical protein
MNHFRSLAALALAGAGLLAWPASAAAQTVSGSASAIRATVFGVTTALGDTGPLADAQDLRDASQMTAAIPSVGTADVLHAATGSSITNGAGDVSSEASLADAGLSVAGNLISAAFVMARATAPAGGAPVGASEIDGLTINGMPVSVTGEPNQVVWLLGGQVILNEQVPTSTGTTVNAVHVIVGGIADVVLATASAGVGSGGSSGTPLPLPPVPPLF